MMKKLLIALGAFFVSVPAFAQWAPDVLLYGASYHFNGAFHPTKYHYNQVNGGIGLELENPDGWLVGVGTYRDSYFKQGYMAYGGYRWVLGDPKRWHTDLTLKAGYLNGSDWHGPAAIPSVGVGYNHMVLEVSGFPPVRGPDAVVFFWLRYKF